MNKAIVDLTECRGCGCCIRSCPTGALKLAKKAEISDGCVLCGLCVKACPFNAISLPKSEE